MVLFLGIRKPIQDQAKDQGNGDIVCPVGADELDESSQDSQTCCYDEQWVAREGEEREHQQCDQESRKTKNGGPNDRLIKFVTEEDDPSGPVSVNRAEQAGQRIADPQD